MFLGNVVPDTGDESTISEGLITSTDFEFDEAEVFEKMTAGLESIELMREKKDIVSD